ncbi:MAG: hypothetical protein QOD69_2152 [Solirubrobacteraceae bacterium]|nr:hypothetical protein [Solirubrobacteraceae bacterium]
MPGLMQRIFRRRSPGAPRPERSGLFRRRTSGKRAWGKKAVVEPLPVTPAPHTEVAIPQTAKASFRDRGRLRRRLRFLRRARELGYRDIGGLIFDMRRFSRSRQDLLDAKLGALGAVDQELRALERALDDRRAIHELREPGISSCARCGALHSSEANFCPHCGLQLGGPRAMGEVGGAIAPPPQPAAPAPAPAATAPPPTPRPAPSQQPTQTFRPPDVPDGS